MNNIVDHIFIGDLRSASDNDLLKINKIDIIINCTNKQTNADFHIPINDPPTESDIDYLNSNFTDIVMFIEKCVREQKNVLIHCIAGSQRSPTIVAIYLMCKYKIHYSNACKLIQQKRPICFFGNVNYIKSLSYIQDKLNMFAAHA